MTTSEKLHAIVGDELMDAICEKLAGETLYIPTKLPVNATMVRRDFEATLPGSSSVMVAYETVGKRHGLSARTIMRIVNW